MLKRSWVWVVGGLMLMLVWGTLVAGCGGGSLKAILEEVDKLGTSEATLSGSISLSGGAMDINLNAVIVSGEALTLPASSFRIKVGDSPSTIKSRSTVDFTLARVTGKPLDIVFILDTTGSMDDAIAGTKDSINAFAASLEAKGADVRFGLVTYGDSPKHPTPTGLITDEGDPEYTDTRYTREVMAFGSASELRAVLSKEVADGGGDDPENPLDAIMWGYKNLTWRPAAQKVFIVITDVSGHQSTDTIGRLSSGGNRCTTSAEAVVEALSGKAVIYAVSPNYTYSLWSGLLDVRRLADGLGEGRVTPESNTGGKWVQFNSGSFDLNKLGIDTTLTAGYTIRFNHTFSAGTYYILLEVDTNGDGIFDSNMLIKIGVSSSSVGAAGVEPKVLATFNNVKPLDAKLLPADDGKARSN